MELFDTHAHYTSNAFDGDRMELLSSMPQQGVKLILNPGCDLPSSQAAVELAEKFAFVYAAVGVHPSDSEGYTEALEGELERLAAHPKVKAIGEIGLDYHWQDGPPADHQKQVFHRQIQLAQRVNLPIIVHDREAHQDCLEIIQQYPELMGVYHCYSGGLDYAKRLVERGWMLSFTGVITFRNNRRAREVLQWLPMEHIMIETDAPYLTPEPFRGRRNDSSKVQWVAQAIGEIKGLDPQEVAQVTRANGVRFFQIEEEAQ